MPPPPHAMHPAPPPPHPTPLYLVLVVPPEGVVHVHEGPLDEALLLDLLLQGQRDVVRLPHRHVGGEHHLQLHQKVGTEAVSRMF